MLTLRNFMKIVDRHTLLVTALALICTFICQQLDIIFELPTALIGTAVIFPLVFSIVSAYRRREEALRYFASLKGHAVALYFAHRDWPPDGHEFKGEGERLVQVLLTAVADYFHADQQDEAVSLQRVYGVYDQFSRSHESMRQHGVTSGEISRSNQYLRAIMIEFERMKNIARYRTPVALRAYSRLFLSLFPILFAPYFASIGYPDYPIVSYGVAILYSLVLVSLDNIQDHLENPYDGVGPDDLRLDVAPEYAKLFESVYALELNP